MRPAEMTPVEIADLLDLAYQQDRGADGLGLTLDQRQSLADYLGCHEDARAAAWELWRTELELRGEDLDDASYWLDVEFVEPCPEDQA